MTISWHHRFIVTLLMGILPFSWVVAVEDRTLEYTVKAGYLYKFLKFVDWPDLAARDESLPIGICVLGDDPFGPLLEPIERQIAKGRALSLAHLERSDSVESCDVLFISASETATLPEILAQLEGRSTLTVGDAEHFARSGGMIGFVERGGNVRLEVNLEAARQAGLKISSNLLEIARIVKKDRS